MQTAVTCTIMRHNAVVAQVPMHATASDVSAWYGGYLFMSDVGSCLYATAHILLLSIKTGPFLSTVV